jgi:hypothetical protein
VAAAFDAASKTPYSFWTSTPNIIAYVMFGLAVATIVCAIRDVPIPPPISRRNTGSSAVSALEDSRQGDAVPH